MKPDFSKYSISELRDVIAHIDSEAYPLRKIEAEEILNRKLESGVTYSKTVENKGNKRQASIVFGTILSLMSFALLYLPLFESSVLTRSSGVIQYSQSPFLFWFYTLLYVFNLSFG